MKNTILLLLIVLPFYFLQAMKYVKADIEYTNGTTKTGYVGFPINQWDTKITFKNVKDGKASRIEAENMFSIIFKDNESIVELRYIHIQELDKKGETDFSKSKKWCVVETGCRDVVVFSEAFNYVMHKRKGFMLEYSRLYGSNLIYLQRRGHSYANTVGYNYEVKKYDNRLKKLFVIRSSDFFKDDPVLVKKIQNDEFKADIVLLLKNYCQKEE